MKNSKCNAEFVGINYRCNRVYKTRKGAFLEIQGDDVWLLNNNPDYPELSGIDGEPLNKYDRHFFNFID